MSNQVEEIKKSLEKDVQSLKDWFKTQLHLPQIELSKETVQI